MSLVAQLADIGKVIDDGEISEIILSGLPEQFNVLATGLETASIANGLTRVVRTRLLQEDHRRNENEVNSAYVPSKRKPVSKLTCSYGKKTGHVAMRCFKNNRGEKGNTSEEYTMLATAFSACSMDEFIVDSGSTSHM